MYIIISIVLFLNVAHLVKLVDTSDLKSDSFYKNIGSSPIMSTLYFNTKMMKLADMLGLGSSSIWIE